MSERILANPRKDAESGKWGLWVDDFDGAEEDALVPVTVTSAAGKQWRDKAVLHRRVTGSDGRTRWIASSARNNGSRDSRPTEPDASSGHESSDQIEPLPCGLCRAAAAGLPRQTHIRPLAEIVHEATGLADWTPDRIETEWVGDHWHIRIGQHPISTSPAESAPAGTSVEDSEPF